MKSVFGVLALLPALVHSLASTDSFRDADPSQSGYLPNHNLNPNIAGSSSFKTLWSFNSPDNDELWLAKPLIYTPTGGSELVITASEKNNIRVFDSKTGTILRQRQLRLPFSSDDSNCGDVPKWIGVTGTPIIDPATDIMYLWSKGYKAGTTSGTPNGEYKMFAIRISDLSDVSGFPVSLEGTMSDNDPGKWFYGGVALQRPALTEANGMIVAGFGSHCGRWNYTGYLVSVSKTPGVGVVSLFATESAPGAPRPQPLDIRSESGGGAGIWQAGMGLPTIGNNIYFVTGNGQGHANGNIPASGRQPMSTLDVSIAKMEISPEGKLSLKDYFQPIDYVGLDAADRDVGSSGLCIMDGSVFNGAGVNRIGVVAGKEGRAYVVNADNLGGFRQGPGGTDGTLQNIELGGALFGGFGSYPAEGGYIYATTVGGPLTAYKLGRDNNGKPFFSVAGRSQWTSAGRVGVGQMTITSDNGRPGSAIVWITDVTVGLAAFKAVPENEVMVRIPLPNLPGSNKFQRPVFGDGRVFYQANSKMLYALGSPVAQAITCESPAEFGNLNIGEVTSKLVSCKANVAIAGFTNCTSSNPSFSCNSASLPATVASGATFNLNVTWDLKNPGTTIVPGALTASVSLALNAGVNYASVSSIDVQGTVASQGPFLHISPVDVRFGNLVLGSQPDGLSTISVIQSVGTSAVTIEGVAVRSASGTYTNITNGNLGNGFSSVSFPAAGTSLAPGSSASLDLKFNQAPVGNYSTEVTVWSTGGVQTLKLSASVNNPPTVAFEISQGDSWVPLTGDLVEFGDVQEGTQVVKTLRICNRGGSTLTITISKPPSNSQLFATSPVHELAEGTQIEPGKCESGGVTVLAGTIQPNRPGLDVQGEWSLTTDGLDPTTGEIVGRRDILFTAHIIVDQLGPLQPNGTALYGYVGCFHDTSSLGRNLQNSVNTQQQQATNTIQQCQSLCFGRGQMFAGLQYHSECWCGNSLKNPSTYVSEALDRCKFDCKGDTLQACGGDGGHMSLYADKTKFDIEAFLRERANPSTSTTTSATSVPTGTSTSSGGQVSTTTTSSIPTSTGGPSHPPTIGSWRFYGCQTEATGIRALSSKTKAADTMTLEECSTFCAGFTYFGVEYARECYCGNKFEIGSVPAPVSECRLTCKGNPNQFCGAGSRLSVYTPGGSSNSSSSSSSSSASSSSLSSSLSSTTSSVTTTSTSSSSSSAVTTTTSVSSTTSSSVATTTATSTSAVTTTSQSSTVSSASSSTSSGPGSACTASPLNPQQPCAVQSKWEYAGCYQDNVNGVRTLAGATTASDDMTLEKCATFCSSGAWNGGAFNFFGTEYSRECYCGWAVTSDLVAPEAECSNPCKGGGPGLCGSGSRLSVFKNNVPNEVPRSPVHVERAGDYKWLGCRTGATSGKALVGKFTASDDMTVEKCAAFCADGNWAFMGIEYSRECMCGSEPRPGSVDAPVAECSMLCKGDRFQYCGAGGRVDMYQFILAPTVSTTTTSVVSTSASTVSSSSSSSVSSSLTTTTSAVESTTSSSASSSSVTSASSSSTVESTTSSSSSVEPTTSSSSSAEPTTSSSSSSSVEPTTSSSSSVEPTTSSSSSSSVEPTTSSSSSVEPTSSSSSSSVEPTTSSSSSVESSTSSSSSVESSTSSSSSVQPTTSASQPSSSPSSSASSGTTTTTTSFVSASTTSTSVTTTSLTPSSTASSTGPVATLGYYHIGCFQDTSGGRALPLLVSNKTITPERCIGHALQLENAPRPTPAPAYVAVEYGQECYGGNSFNFKGSAVTSLVGTKACTNICAGSISTITRSGTTTVTTATDNRCGGRMMFNLYAKDTTVDFPTTGGPVVTQTAQ